MSPTGTIALRAGMECESSASLIDFIYLGIDSNPPPPPEHFLNRMILAPRNADVSEINSTVLQSVSGVSRTYFSADKIIEEEGADGPSRDESRLRARWPDTPLTLPGQNIWINSE